MPFYSVQIRIKKNDAEPPKDVNIHVIVASETRPTVVCRECKVKMRPRSKIMPMIIYDEVE